MKSVMKKRFIFIFSIFILFFTLVQNTNALPVYVGIKILNMTDDSASSCINAAGGDYSSTGRIRALSSILPWYPIYFNLTNQSNGATIWSGDSTKDTDYAIGDIIYLPNAIDLISGTNYNLFFDIDAIRIYLPLQDYTDGGSISWTATNNDEYWTAGYRGTDGGTFELFVRSNDNVCSFFMYLSRRPNEVFFIKNSRGVLTHSCMGDFFSHNCDEQGFISIDYASTESTRDFKIDSKYGYLYQPNTGNFNIAFTMP